MFEAKVNILLFSSNFNLAGSEEIPSDIQAREREGKFFSDREEFWGN